MQTTYELNLLAAKAFARFLRKHLSETNFTPFGVHIAVSVALQQPNIHGGVAKWKSILNKKGTWLTCEKLKGNWQDLRPQDTQLLGNNR